MNTTDLIAADLEWWRALLAVAVVVAGLILSRFAKRAVLALVHRAPGISETIAALTSRIAGYAVVLLAFGIGLALLGANVQPLLAIVIIVAAVLVLVLRGVADNFAAGVLIQARRPIRLGDEIVVDGPDGVLIGAVSELNARSVVLVTRDGRTVHVPNARILQEVIVNDSAHGARRSVVQVRVRRDGDEPQQLADAISSAVGDVDGVHKCENVRATVIALSEKRVTINVWYWHHPLHGPMIGSEVVTMLDALLRAKGVTATITSEPVSAPLTPPDTR